MLANSQHSSSCAQVNTRDKGKTQSITALDVQQVLGLNVTSRSTAITIRNQKQIYVRAQGDKAQGKAENKRKVES